MGLCTNIFSIDPPPHHSAVKLPHLGTGTSTLAWISGNFNHTTPPQNASERTPGPQQPTEPREIPGYSFQSHRISGRTKFSRTMDLSASFNDLLQAHKAPPIQRRLGLDHLEEFLKEAYRIVREFSWIPSAIYIYMLTVTTIIELTHLKSPQRTERRPPSIPFHCAAPKDASTDGPGAKIPYR